MLLAVIIDLKSFFACRTPASASCPRRLPLVPHAPPWFTLPHASGVFAGAAVPQRTLCCAVPYAGGTNARKRRGLST
ncbi:MAG: hypothetical protein OXH69_10425, partial [Acidobacteria bacterium]|nr:hypothetical protein [Acidobacteriota bacterium]